MKDSIRFHATGYDTNGTVEKYLWSFNLAKWDTVFDSIYRYAFADTISGEKKLYVKGIDDDGIVSKTDSMSVTVHIYAPLLKFSNNDTSIAVYDTLQLKAWGSDTNGTIKSVIWTVSGNVPDTVEDSIYRIVFGPSDAGANIISARVIDDDGIMSRAESLTVTVSLYAPKVRLKLSDSIFTLDTIRATASASDSNGLILKYCWSTDGSHFDTSGDSTSSMYWSTPGTGKIFAKVIDDDGVVSPIDSVYVKLLWDTTVVVKTVEFNDTAVANHSIAHNGNSARIQQFLTKCVTGGAVKLGFIGGSVTSGASATVEVTRYANRFSRMMENQFTGAQFSVVNAGIAYTTSRFACSRVKDDLIAAAPDLIVIEFAVSDNSSDSTGTVAAMEGLVRQCLAYRADVPVIMLETADTSGAAVNQRLHSYIAGHYGIPMVSFRDVVWPFIAAGTIARSDLFGSGGFPNDNGHMVCGYLLYYFVKGSYESMLRGSSDAAQQMPSPLITDLYQHAGILATNDTMVKVVSAGGWTTVNKESSRTGFTSNHARDSLIVSTNAREVVILYHYASELTSVSNVYNNGTLAGAIDNNFSSGWTGGYLKQFMAYKSDQSQSHAIAISHLDRFVFTVDYILYAR